MMHTSATSPLPESKETRSDTHTLMDKTVWLWRLDMAAGKGTDKIDVYTFCRQQTEHVNSGGSKVPPLLISPPLLAHQLIQASLSQSHVHTYRHTFPGRLILTHRLILPWSAFSHGYSVGWRGPVTGQSAEQSG
eukprot:1159520-Pelagomonas_calceolata.AAC.4